MKGRNKRIYTLQDDFKNLFNNYKCSAILIFGLNMENDQHIIRNLILELFNNNVNDPQIIYSYFNDGEDLIFQEEVDKLITFRSDVNEYCHNIELKFIRTQDLYHNIFTSKLPLLRTITNCPQHCDRKPRPHCISNRGKHEQGL
jgi:hypothetical protein